jgi:hypothetical protein
MYKKDQSDRYFDAAACDKSKKRFLELSHDTIICVKKKYFRMKELKYKATKC